ncbi:transcriptional regulator PerR [Alkaliphilus serpentinus]|uniref:Transcriptional repressor n=1 Tax=Alkaliphilus serpentinus TaxID=1482731 RepID=A0A833MDL6_9FIRM|nr:Fur family transcriptional regulator [Alkaliphilus serpentinus]KAB3529156.1 transcriptional repressor [Alkaliphilus serpentinus]
METLVKTLKASCCKVTPQRLAVYNTLKLSKDHPNAEAIFKLLEPAYPSISLATIYKSLELFSELNLIQVINVGENSFRYDPNPYPHPHIICTTCNKVEDLSDEYFKDLANTVEEISNYKISKQQLCFYGQCPSCTAKNPS